MVVKRGIMKYIRPSAIREAREFRRSSDPTIYFSTCNDIAFHRRCRRRFFFFYAIESNSSTFQVAQSDGSLVGFVFQQRVHGCSLVSSLPHTSVHEPMSVDTHARVDTYTSLLLGRYLDKNLARNRFILVKRGSLLAISFAFPLSGFISDFFNGENTERGD